MNELRCTGLYFLVAFLAVSGPAIASGIPEDGLLDFAILRNGEQIGRHTILFEGRGEPTIVRITAEVDYRLGFIPLYIFRHAARETWRDGGLIGMQAETNDNGDDYDIAFTVEGAQGALSINDETTAIDTPLRPASLWNNAVIGDQVTLDPADGDLMSVSVSAAGEEMITVRGWEIRAHRYEMTWDFQRMLWYDRRNVLVQVVFDGRDGSEIRYQLR